jgi:hypothetical protein
MCVGGRGGRGYDVFVWEASGKFVCPYVWECAYLSFWGRGHLSVYVLVAVTCVCVCVLRAVICVLLLLVVVCVCV